MTRMRLDRRWRRAACLVLLYRRAFHGAVRAEDAAVAGVRPQQGAARCALV